MIKIIIAVLAVAVIAGLGWTVFKPALEGSQKADSVLGVNQQNQEDLISPQPDLTRVKLQALLNEHGILTGSYLTALYDGKDTTDSAKNLDENSQKLADFVSGLGAPKDRFLTMWQDHIKGYEDYTQALKTQNQTGTADAKAGLDTQADKMGEMINKLLPSISPEHGTDLMKEHIDLTLSIIDAHAKGDSVTYAAEVAKAAAQATKFGSELADGFEQSVKSPDPSQD